MIFPSSISSISGSSIVVISTVKFEPVDTVELVGISTINYFTDEKLSISCDRFGIKI